MYNLISYYELSPIQLIIFRDFLKEASLETSQPAYSNMWDEDWQNKTNTLPYILANTDRFRTTGVYNILFNKNTVIGCSGVYTSAFSKDIAIAGTRTWVSNDYRNLSIARDYLLPAEKKWAIDNNHKAIVLCFNEYNKNLIKIWKRKRLGEKRSPRLPKHVFYNGVNELKYPVTIQYTKQWIIYEKLDPSFDFDWTIIK